MEIPYLKSASATVAAVAVILSTGFSVDRVYIDSDELDTKLKLEIAPTTEMVEHFIPEWKQQRIWDMEENVEKSSSPEEKRRWLQRLKKLISEFCESYPGRAECHPQYLDYLKENDDE